MIRSFLPFLKPWLWSFALLALGFPSQAHAYVDLAPTLTKIIGDSQKIYLVEVVEFSQEKHTLALKEVRALKGVLEGKSIQHDVAGTGGALVPRVIQQWAEPGARGVLFISRNTSLLCLGEGWYAVRTTGDGVWKLSSDRADLPLAYYGSVSQLADGIAQMLAGKDAILTTVQHGADGAASFDLALNRTSLPGLVRAQRIRANMAMPAMVMAVSANPAYLIGKGRVGEDDLPSLLVQLKNPDAHIRAEAADDLRELGHKAVSASPTLIGLLNDPSPRVRLAAASTLLAMTPDNKAATDVLIKGLADPNSTVRRNAAQATGLAGPGAAPLTAQLALLLKDNNEATRVAALQAIATLGPIAAAAAPAVVPFLNDPTTCVEAADALGRIGPSARPAPQKLVDMLASDQTAVKWAAVRALAQIGGPEAHPVVDFIKNNMPEAPEIDTYNMLIYLSLLGPVANDAIPTVTQMRMMLNPILPSATVWAIQANRMPWQPDPQGGGRGFGGRGGRGGPGGGFGGPGGGGLGGMNFDLYTTMYEAYIRELGERLRPLALQLLQNILDGTGGDIPTWGYKILNAAPAESIAKLSACLTDSNPVVRERAIVALGYMGAVAFPAKDKVSQAIYHPNPASTEQELLLLEWCLRQITA